MQGRRRADAHHARLDGQALRGKGAQDAGHSDVPRRRVVDDDAALPGGAAAGDHAVAPVQRLHSPFARDVPLGIGEAQVGVGDDAVELGRQRALGEHGQPVQIEGVRADPANHLAIVGRVRDRVLHQCAQALALIAAHVLTRPVVAQEHLRGQALDAFSAGKSRARTRW